MGGLQVAVLYCLGVQVVSQGGVVVQGDLWVGKGGRGFSLIIKFIYVPQGSGKFIWVFWQRLQGHSGNK